jgi:hypothetical protein
MAVNPTEIWYHQKYMPQGHKHLALGNKNCGKGRDPMRHALDKVEMNFLDFKINLGYGGKSYRDMVSSKIYSSGA